MTFVETWPAQRIEGYAALTQPQSIQARRRREKHSPFWAEARERERERFRAFWDSDVVVRVQLLRSKR